jgi:hypothetical protein
MNRRYACRFPPVDPDRDALLSFNVACLIDGVELGEILPFGRDRYRSLHRRPCPVVQTVLDACDAGAVRVVLRRESERHISSTILDK